MITYALHLQETVGEVTYPEAKAIRCCLRKAENLDKERSHIEGGVGGTTSYNLHCRIS